jgi:hypothetical protein
MAPRPDRDGEIRNERGFPIARPHAREVAPVPNPALRRTVALVWATLQIVGSVAAGFAIYFSLVTVVLPGVAFDVSAWAEIIVARWLFVVSLSVGMSFSLRVVNRAVFTWVHAGDEPPEPALLFRLLVGATAAALVVGTAESALVNWV